MNTVELKQWGNSLAVRLHKAVLSKAELVSYQQNLKSLLMSKMRLF